ncbi:hypothetical protein APHAL10511_007603 [Amanita phalloides]|nr:hypothetical protein APHAL10511_007603 [Amanita phalloides]
MPGLTQDPTLSDEEDYELDDTSSEEEQVPLPQADAAEIEEIRTEEFPSYFIERDGMLFHSVPTAPYPLPVEGHEQQRLNSMHKMLQRLLQGNYVGPVPDVLAENPDAQVLDLGTGTGKWVLAMARQFRQVQFIGVDIVPIATTYPPRNVRFEMHDINEHLRWADGTFDLIHARDISMAIRNWPVMVREVARLLRSNGLFISCEWVLTPTTLLNVDLQVYAPAAVQFANVVFSALSHRGVIPVGRNMRLFLEQSQQFYEITVDTRHVPIGGNTEDETLNEIGHKNSVMWQRFTRSVTPLLRGFGLTEYQVGQLVAGYQQELDSVEGLAYDYQITYARKI